MALSRRPTIKDVAKIAGVTYPTVSRVLSGKPYVALETKARVLNAITELGYRPSLAARSMVTQKTHIIAMLVPHLSDPNFGMFFSGAESKARAHGYSVLVADFGGATDLIGQHRVDGALILEPQYFLGHDLLSELPFVELGEIIVDNQMAGRAVGEYLLQLGHLHVVFVGAPKDSPPAMERFAGLREHFPDAVWYSSDWTAKGGAVLLESVLSANPTAIFAANDFVALGLLSGLQQRGLEVPKDISLIGFDDIPLAQYYSPSLTTVHQDLELQGANATEILIAKLQGQAKPDIQPICPHIIVRESTISRLKEV